MAEQFVTVALIAVVLGMDAFSLALGLGLKGVSYRYEIKFSAIVGLKEIRPQSYSFSSAAMLRNQAELSTMNNMWLLCGSVSMDALAVGFGLGTFQMPLLATVLTMGSIAAVMTWLGFLGGRILNLLVGSYAQIIGGLVLIALAAKLLWF